MNKYTIGGAVKREYENVPLKISIYSVVTIIFISLSVYLFRTINEKLIIKDCLQERKNELTIKNYQISPTMSETCDKYNIKFNPFNP